MPLFGRRKERADREQERIVVAGILAACPDTRARMFYEQFARSSSLLHTDTDDGFTVKVQATRAEVPTLTEDVTSDWVTVHDIGSGAALEFRVLLRRGGTFHSLEARAPGGTWPAAWRVDGVELAQAAVGSLRLTEEAGPACVEQLALWLGVEAPDGAPVACSPPAADRDLAALVSRQGADLPEGLGRTLLISDGLDIGGLRVYGTQDLFTIEEGSGTWWLIADEGDADDDDADDDADDDEHDSRYLAPPGAGNVWHVPTHDTLRADWRDTGLDVRGWLASRLGG